MTIKLTGVNFAHPDTPEKTVLSIPNWSLATGEQVFVHGPSGSGKSTLLNIISGLAFCTEGTVSVLGNRLDQMNSRQRDHFRANHIGYVFQRFNLIPYLSALDNIELALSFCTRPDRRVVSKEVSSLLESLNVDKSNWKRPTAQLSTGQQQRVAIARALVNRPEVLLADEPTSSLDRKNRDNFMSLLMPHTTEHNTTLILVSHDIEIAAYFERVQALSDISEAT